MHSPVRVVGEFLLAAAGVWVGQFGQPISGPRNGQQIVVDRSGNRVILQQKPLFAALDVQRRCSIAEAEAVPLVDDIEDSAEVERPEAERMRLYGYDFLRLDPGLGICDPHPAQIELPPLAKGFSCGVKSLWPAADFGSGVVADVASGQVELVGSALGIEGNSVAAGQISRDLQLPANRRLRRFAEREHWPQYVMVRVVPLPSSVTADTTR